MLAREYNKRISVYQVEDVPDGYGGNTVVKTVLSESWAKLVNSSSSLNQRATNLGITDLYEPLLFKLRHRNDLPYNGRNLYLQYQGEDYVIKSITDVSELHREIEILCTKTIPESVPLIVMPEPELLYTLLGNYLDSSTQKTSLEEIVAYHEAAWEDSGFPNDWIVAGSIVVMRNSDGVVIRLDAGDESGLYQRLVDENDLTVFDEVLEAGFALYAYDDTEVFTYTSFAYIDEETNLKLIYQTTADGNIIIDYPPAP